MAEIDTVRGPRSEICPVWFAPTFKEERKTKRFIVIAAMVVLCLLHTVRVDLVAKEPAKNEKRQPETAAVAVPKDKDVSRKTDFATLEANLKRLGLGPYRIAPPDVVTFETSGLTPKESFLLLPGDLMFVEVMVEEKFDPSFSFLRSIAADGQLELTGAMGSIRAVGLTIAECKDRLRKHLEKRDVTVKKISITLPKLKESISKELMVDLSGQIDLKRYGKVKIAGMTLAAATSATKKNMSEMLNMDHAKVVLNVSQTNSRTYWIIIEGNGTGDHMRRMPYTGNETVLDAIANLRKSDLPGATNLSNCKIWISRPADGGKGKAQILSVDWEAITVRGDSVTNYQLLPEDRLFISPKPPAAIPIATAPKPHRLASPYTNAPSGDKDLFAIDNEATNVSKQIAFHFHVLDFEADSKSAKEVLHKVFPKMKKLGSLAIVGPDMTAKNIQGQLSKHGHVKLVNDPRMIATTGRPAYFRVGGRIVVPVAQGDNTWSTETKEFGTRIDFLPCILANGKLHLELKVELSNIDPLRTITVDSLKVPGITTREMDTAVELEFGQSLIMNLDAQKVVFSDPAAGAKALKRCTLLVATPGLVSGTVNVFVSQQ